MWESFWFEFINFYFIPGLVLGCIYALGAIGITLTPSKETLHTKNILKKFPLF